MRSLGPDLSQDEVKLRHDGDVGVLRPVTGGPRELRLDRFDGLVTEAAIRDANWGPFLIEVGILMALYVAFAPREGGGPALGVFLALLLLAYVGQGRTTLLVVGLTEKGKIEQRLLVSPLEFGGINELLSDSASSASD